MYFTSIQTNKSEILVEKLMSSQQVTKAAIIFEIYSFWKPNVATKNTPCSEKKERYPCMHERYNLKYSVKFQTLSVLFGGLKIVLFMFEVKTSTQNNVFQFFKLKLD